MEPLNLPTYLFSIKEDRGKKFIFDEIRRRYVSLTPEEWVRQHIVKFLSGEKQFPVQLISVEKGFSQNRLAKRYDLLVYDRSGRPLMIIECKSPSVEINQKTFDQATLYNQKYLAKYVLVTNGRKHYCCIVDMKKKSYSFLKDIPAYVDICS
jgi:hypothetical protein